MRSLTTGKKLVAAFVLASQLSVTGVLAADLLVQAKQLAIPAQTFPELKQINDQFTALFVRMETNTNQLKAYRKARVRATDRRYSSLTREFNQTRTRMSELERRLERAPSLDLNRFPVPAGSDRGSSSSDIRERAMSAEYKKYDQAKTALRQSLKSLSDHYDEQLRVIARLR